MTGIIFDVESEQAMLSLLLTYPELSLENTGVKVYMLDSTPHILLFRTIQDIVNDGLVPDAGMVLSTLESNGKLAEAGGKAHINGLLSRGYNKNNYREFCKQVINNYKVKTLLKILSEVDKGSISTKDIDQLLDGLRVQFEQLTGNSNTDTTLDFNSALEIAWAKIAEKVGSHTLPGITTGIKDLDVATGGMMEGEEWIIGGRPSMGKAQPLYSKVMTPTGWKTMGEIQKGDLVIGEDGDSHKVLEIFPQGIRPIYRVTLSDGSFTDCDLEHLWLTSSRHERKENKQPSVKTLQEIMNSGIYASGSTNTKRKNHSISFTSPIKFPKKNLFIEPYIMGLLLGDGCFCKKSIEFYKPDAELILAIESNPNKNYSVTKYKDGCRIIKDNDGNNSIRKSLETYNLLNKHSYDKFIPRDYLYSSVEDRMALLQGLLDTDGYPTKNFVEYSTTSPHLAEDVKFLVQSLGGSCNVITRMGSYKLNGENHVTRINYRLYIRFPNDIILFRLNRKAIKHGHNNRHFLRFIEKIEYLYDFEAKCIYIDSRDHLYITDNFIVTHNTGSLCNFSLSGAKIGIPSLIISKEMNIQAITERMLAIETGITISDIRQGALDQKQINLLTEKIKEIKNYPIYVDCNFTSDIGDILNNIRKYKRTKGIRVVYFDYLQLMVGESDENQTQELGKYSRAFKLLSEELSLTSVLYSQLNRMVEMRPDKRPILSDLRQSGNLEQDADLVIMLYRDDYYDSKSSSKGILEMIIRKSRNGPTGVVASRFDPTTNKIYSI